MNSELSFQKTTKKKKLEKSYMKKKRLMNILKN